MKRYPERVPKRLDDPFSAVLLHTRLPNDEFSAATTSPEFAGLGGIHIGYAILEQFEQKKLLPYAKKLVDLVAEGSTERTSRHYKIDALIGSAAIELAYLSNGNTTLRRLRCPGDERLLALSKLGNKEPYRSIAQGAILYVREFSLIDQYIQPGRLAEPDVRFQCAQQFSQAIFSA